MYMCKHNKGLKRTLRLRSVDRDEGTKVKATYYDVEKLLEKCDTDLFEVELLAYSIDTDNNGSNGVIVTLDGFYQPYVYDSANGGSTFTIAYLPPSGANTNQNQSNSGSCPPVLLNRQLGNYLTVQLKDIVSGGDARVTDTWNLTLNFTPVYM